MPTHPPNSPAQVGTPCGLAPPPGRSTSSEAPRRPYSLRTFGSVGASVLGDVFMLDHVSCVCGRFFSFFIAPRGSKKKLERVARLDNLGRMGHERGKGSESEQKYKKGKEEIFRPQKKRGVTPLHAHVTWVHLHFCALAFVPPPSAARLPLTPRTR